jgi:hypothetical protein
MTNKLVVIINSLKGLIFDFKNVFKSSKNKYMHCLSYVVLTFWNVQCKSDSVQVGIDCTYGVCNRESTWNPNYSTMGPDWPQREYPAFQCCLPETLVHHLCLIVRSFLQEEMLRTCWKRVISFFIFLIAIVCGCMTFEWHEWGITCTLFCWF